MASVASSSFVFNTKNNTLLPPFSTLLSSSSSSSFSFSSFLTPSRFHLYPSPSSALPCSHLLLQQQHYNIPRRRPRRTAVSSEEEVSSTEEEEDEWLRRLPDKKKPLYSHSLPCIEAWLRGLGFCQSKDDRAVWFVEKPDWHAQLSLDVIDLYIRYLKSGPGNLEKDVERRFSYALSREDIENAILGGP